MSEKRSWRGLDAGGGREVVHFFDKPCPDGMVGHVKKEGRIGNARNFPTHCYISYTLQGVPIREVPDSKVSI